jgi:hypothetical protein
MEEQCRREGAWTTPRRSSGCGPLLKLSFYRTSDPTPYWKKSWHREETLPSSVQSLLPTDGLLTSDEKERLPLVRFQEFWYRWHPGIEDRSRQGKKKKV